jgi:hypothetical protein
LLELHNIPVHRYENANIYNLTAELAKGHKVIVGIHADDLWSNNWLWRDIRQAFGFSNADHAVVVSGIDTHDPDHPEVIISDPGDGAVALHYPIEQFLPAWREGNFFMVATQNPPPASMHLPEMVNFDYHAGHIHHIGDLPYSDFERLAAEHTAHTIDTAWLSTHDPAHHLLDRVGHSSGADSDLHHQTHDHGDHSGHPHSHDFADLDPHHVEHDFHPADDHPGDAHSYDSEHAPDSFDDGSDFGHHHG